jgi:hypothetical protein
MCLCGGRTVVGLSVAELGVVLVVVVRAVGQRVVGVEVVGAGGRHLHSQEREGQRVSTGLIDSCQTSWVIFGMLVP